MKACASIVEQPELMPNYPPARALRRGIDLAYGRRQITASVTSSILQGRSLRGIADDLQQRITTMDRTSAIRTARTAFTGAQNAGRMDSYEMGIKLKKEWLATLDGRTRHSHAALDGEKVGTDEKFSNGCRFPGDPQGRPGEVYNCRCTMVAALDDVDTSDAQRRARDPETGESVVISDMTYQEWVGWKQKATKHPATFSGTSEITASFGIGMKETLSKSTHRETKEVYAKYEDELKCVDGNYKRAHTSLVEMEAYTLTRQVHRPEVDIRIRIKWRFTSLDITLIGLLAGKTQLHMPPIWRIMEKD